MIKIQRLILYLYRKDYCLIYAYQHLQLECNMWRKSYVNVCKGIYRDKKDIRIKFAREEEVKHH